MTKATEVTLAALHGVVAQELTRRIKTSEATAADLGAAIKFLKDNQIAFITCDKQSLTRASKLTRVLGSKHSALAC